MHSRGSRSCSAVKCEQQNLEHTINSAYHAISAKEWEKIRAPIREKISKLVSKALRPILAAAMENSAREQYVERFLLKIWEAKCPSGDFMSRMNRLSGGPS